MKEGGWSHGQRDPVPPSFLPELLPYPFNQIEIRVNNLLWALGPRSQIENRSFWITMKLRQKTINLEYDEIRI